MRKQVWLDSLQLVRSISNSMVVCRVGKRYLIDGDWLAVSNCQFVCMYLLFLIFLFVRGIQTHPYYNYELARV